MADKDIYKPIYSSATCPQIEDVSSGPTVTDSINYDMASSTCTIYFIYKIRLSR